MITKRSENVYPLRKMEYDLPKAHEDAYLGNIPHMDSTQQTMMWQNQGYIMDSGINSEMTSTAPSIKSGLNSGEITPPPNEYEQMPLSRHYSEQQLNGNHGMQNIPPAQCIKTPYPMDGCPKSSNMISDNSFPMTHPSQEISSAFTNLISYQSEDDITQVAIPELVELLKAEDCMVVDQAAMMVHQLWKKEAMRPSIINTPQLIVSLIRGIKVTVDTEVMRRIAGTLHGLSHYAHCLQVMFKAGIVPVIVKLLSSNVESILFYAITTLHNLLLIQEGSKMAVRAEGGLQKLVALLQHNNVKFLAITTDCLQILAYQHQESKMTIFSCNGTIQLVRIMQNHSYEKLLWTCARLLKVLSVCPQNKQAIIAAGGLTTLCKHLCQNNSFRILQICLWTLRNLSDEANKMDNLDQLLDVLVQMLNINDASIVACVAGILSNLTCENQMNKMFVCRIGGIEALIKTINCFAGMEEIIEPTICALRHLTCKHPDAEIAQNSVRMFDGLPLLVKLLQPPSSWLLMKAVLGLMGNLALSPANQAPLREYNAIPKVAQILARAHQDLQKSSHNPGNVYVDGVAMEQILEYAVNTLHCMSKDEQTRNIIISLGLVQILCQLLHFPNEIIQERSAKVLTELASGAEGVAMIEKQGAIARLSELVRSRNQILATSATNVLFQLMKERPSETHLFQQRMMNSEKFRTGPIPAPSSASSSMWTQKPMTSWNEWGNTAPNFNQSMSSNMIPMSNNHAYQDLDMGPPDMGYESHYGVKNMKWYGYEDEPQH